MSPEYDALRQIRSRHAPTVKAEIGEVLKAVRLKKGLSLEAVARQTRISKRFLEALEGDRFDEFPAMVYLRGFMKGYCDFLETEFEPLWAKVEAASAPPPAPGEAPAAPAAAPATPEAPAASAPAAAAPAPAPASQVKPHDKGHAKPHKPVAPAPHAAPSSAAPSHAAPSHASPSHAAPSHGHAPASSGGGAAGAIAFSLVLAAGLGWWVFSTREAAAPAAAPEPPKALQPLPPAVEPIVLLTVKDDAWLRVTVDGAAVFEGRAPRGSTQEWRPKKSLGLRTTSPEAVAVQLNGVARELGAPGPDGEHRIDLP